MFYTYILKSLKDGKYYYVHSSDISERIKTHNKGKVRATKGRLPVELVYSEEFETRSEAVKRKLYFKSIEGYNWLKENKII